MFGLSKKDRQLLEEIRLDVLSLRQHMRVLEEEFENIEVTLREIISTEKKILDWVSDGRPSPKATLRFVLGEAVPKIKGEQ